MAGVVRIRTVLRTSPILSLIPALALVNVATCQRAPAGAMSHAWNMVTAVATLWLSVRTRTKEVIRIRTAHHLTAVILIP